MRYIKLFFTALKFGWDLFCIKWQSGLNKIELENLSKYNDKQRNAIYG